MKKKLIFMALAIMFNTYVGYGQTAQPTVGANVRVFPSNTPQSEVSISINKLNPANLIISANTNFVSGSGGNQGFYQSSNAGVTWTGSNSLQNISANGVLGDPATCFDAFGSGYLATINLGDDSYQMERSDDEGVHWSNPVTAISSSLGESFDKEMITAFDEMPTSPFVNNVYAAWIDFNGGPATRFNRSTDRGATFSTPITLATGFGTGTNVQTGPNGEVYVCWVNRTGGSSTTSSKATGIGFAFSNDGGATFPAANIHNPAFAEIGLDVDLRVASDAPGPFAGTTVPFFPSMAVDKSCGPRHGRIYIAFMEKESNVSNRSVIRVRFSDNNGATWANSVTITPPTVLGQTVQENWFPWIAVDDMTGLVNVVYYCMDQTTGNATNTYVAYSVDGATTWQSIRVSDAAHQHGAIDNTMFRAGYCGDYIGIASFGGRSYVAWHDNRPITGGATTGPWNVYMAQITYGNIPTIISSQTDLIINAPPSLSGSQLLEAHNSIQVSTTSAVNVAASGSNIEMKAGENIVMNPGFMANSGSVFLAHIEPVDACASPFISNKEIFSHDAFAFPNANVPYVDITSYPNPTQDYITVVCNSSSKFTADFFIRDLNGKIIYSTNTNSRIDNSYRFVYDCTDLSQGVYFYTIQNQDFIRSGKFIKQ